MAANVTKAKARAAAAPDPLWRRVTVVAQDPAMRDENGNIVMSTITVPAEDLEDGPMGYRVHVVDYDASERKYLGAHRIPENTEKEPPAWRKGSPSIEHDVRFHAQNVYALVMKTLARFEFALGRRVGWSFDHHQIKVAPHGMMDANAFYSPRDEGLVFGYFQGETGRLVQTCLSHDVVVHEATHAILDGLRERYLDPSSPDQAAFHEGFADVVALLSVFSQPELVLVLLRRRASVQNELIRRADISEDALARSALFGLAEQLGEEMQGIRRGALRESLTIPPDPKLLDQPEYREPHRRGEILVAAVMNAFVKAWASRIATSGTPDQTRYPIRRVAEEGCDIADAIATMWIRAIDYMPPVHVTFADALSAALTADAEVRPDDTRYGLRAALRAAFAGFGIMPASDPAGDGTWKKFDKDPNYDRVRQESMRFNENEVFRFIWENREALEVKTFALTKVLSVRPCQRVGLDGFTLRETVAEYYQFAQLTAAELRREGIKIPDGYAAELKQLAAPEDVEEDAPRARADEHEIPGTTPLFGGGVLIFDEYGRLKYNIHNRVCSQSQEARIQYLWDVGMLEAGALKSRLAPSRLSELHRRRALDLPRRPLERW